MELQKHVGLLIDKIMMDSVVNDCQYWVYDE